MTPRPDECEVTLLGRSVGESVVVHLGQARWMIVDSFNDRGRPAARRYLDELGVDADAVDTIVITHFHADHYRGVAELHDYYRRARLAVTGALSRELFRQLFGDLRPHAPLEGLPQTIMRAKERQLAAGVQGLRHLHAGQQVHVSQDATVTALSPSDAASNAANEELGHAIDASRHEAIVQKLRNDNRCSVVLLVEALGHSILLGADLEASPAQYGWQAIVNDPNNGQLPTSDIVKVPHHGSETSDDEHLRQLCVNEPTMLVAPYSSSGLPQPQDLERLCAWAGEAGELWQAAPSTSPTVLDGTGRTSPVKQPVGWVRARRGIDDHRWRVEALDPGHPVGCLP